MKKLFIAIFMLTSVFSLGSILTSEYLSECVGNVQIYTVQPQNIENTIVCNGTIEYSREYSVKYDDSLIINEIFVKSGDKVKKGDLLFSANKVSYKSTSGDISQEDIYTALISGDYSSIKNSTSKNRVEEIGDEVKIYSKYDGIITSLEYKSGETAASSASLAYISPNNEYNVVLSINESQISDISLGQTVIVTGSGFKDLEYSGTVSAIGNEAKQVSTAIGKSTAVEVTVKIEDADDKIKNGFSAKCTILTSIENNCIIVPYECVCSEDDGKEFIYVYYKGFAKKKYITTGNEYSQGFEITDGIKFGDMIILNPSAVKNPGRVKIIDRQGGEENVE